jgi:hypothetical protein
VLQLDIPSPDTSVLNTGLDVSIDQVSPFAMGHHALVFGASGILGWAIVNEILSNYPEKDTYSKVTALTNRPLTREEALWPQPGGERPDLNIVSGIDLTQGTTEDVRAKLKEQVPDIDSVTQVHYFGKIEISL